MHYHAEIHVPENQRSNLEKYIEEVMQPFYYENEGGWWDWYQIGGRWTGIHTHYNPEDDPDNLEKCDLCGGTGKRTDWGENTTPEWIEQCNGCNGCQGKGIRVKWPTQWKRYSGDVIPVYKIDDELECFTLIAGGNVLHKEDWKNVDWQAINKLEEEERQKKLEDLIKTDFNGKVKEKLIALGITDGYMVTVDYHD